MILHKHKLYFSNSTLNILISIYETEQTQSLFFKKKKIHKIKKLKQYINNINSQIKNNNTLTKTKKILLYKNYKIILNEIDLLQQKIDKNNNFSKQDLLENLSFFTDYKFNINLKIKQINNVKQIKHLIKNLNNKKYSKKINHSKLLLLKLRKFEKTSFYKEGKHLFLPLITKYNTANLLANFISTQLKTIKQQNFFYNFLKESLYLTINQKFSQIQGIKLIIKGRLNNSARAKHKRITLGKTPLMTIQSKINYAESTAFTSNGTFGIKVWICNKNKK